MNNQNEIIKETKYKIPESLSSYLITEIKKYDYLWNSDVPDYLNKEKKMATYNAIADSLHDIYNTHGEFNGDEVYKKWQNIRSQYRRHRIKRDSFFSLHGQPLNKTWKHAESLGFLDNVICRRVKKDEYDLTLGNDLIQLVDGDDNSFFDDYQSDSVDASAVSSLPGSSSQTASRFRNHGNQLNSASSMTTTTTGGATTTGSTAASTHQGISLPVRNVIPSKHHSSTMDIHAVAPKRIKVEPYQDPYACQRGIAGSLSSQGIPDRLDNFGAYIASEIRSMSADKRNHAITSIFDVVKQSWNM